MLNSFLLAIRFLILVFSGHKQVALENLALRQQLAVFTREKKRPRLHNRDRVFCIALTYTTESGKQLEETRWPR
jgi:hypothetical protein